MPKVGTKDRKMKVVVAKRKVGIEKPRPADNNSEKCCNP